MEKKRNRDRKPLIEHILHLKQCDMCLGWFITRQKHGLRCSDHCKKKANNLKTKQWQAKNAVSSQLAGRVIDSGFGIEAHFWVQGADEEAQGLVTPAM